MKSSVLKTALAGAVLLAPVLASAQPQDTAPARPRQARPAEGPTTAGPQGREAMRNNLMRKIADRGQTLKLDLALTDTQKADLRKSRESAQRDRLRKSTDLKIARMDLRSLMSAEKVDEKAIAAKLAEVQAAQGALLKIRVDQALAMKRILTPEQQKKIADMRGQRGGRAGQRMKLRGMRGQGRMGGARRMGPTSHQRLHGAGPGHGFPMDDLDDQELDDQDEFDHDFDRPESPTVR